MMGRVPSPLVAVPGQPAGSRGPRGTRATSSRMWPKRRPDLDPQGAQRRRRGRRRSGNQQAQPAFLDAEAIGQGLDLSVRQRTLDQERGNAAVPLDPEDTGGPVAASDVGVLVDLATAGGSGARNVDSADDAARGDRRLESAKARLAQAVRHVLDLEVDPQIGTVVSVAEHRVVVGEARVRSGRLDSGQREHPREQPLDQAVDVLLVDEGHLDVDLGELGLAVGAQILVAEATGELDVALESADHQNLLEQLGRLRKRVETAVVQAARHEIVAGALRRRASEHRRLDVHETLLPEVAQALDREIGAHAQVALQALPAKVEEAVLEAGLLTRALSALHAERHRLRGAEHAAATDLDLDLAGGHLRVHLVGVPTHDFALDLDDPFEAGRIECLGCVRRAFRMHDGLDDAAPIAHVEEDHAAVIAPAVDPSLDPRPLADPLRGQRSCLRSVHVPVPCRTAPGSNRRSSHNSGGNSRLHRGDELVARIVS